jgi:hypothetical protein
MALLRLRQVAPTELVVDDPAGGLVMVSDRHGHDLEGDIMRGADGIAIMAIQEDRRVVSKSPRAPEVVIKRQPLGCAAGVGPKKGNR